MIVECSLVLRDATQNLGCFPFDLLLLTSDVWNNIIDDIKTGYTWVSRSRDCLHGSDQYSFDWAEGFFKCGERDD